MPTSPILNSAFKLWHVSFVLEHASIPQYTDFLRDALQELWALQFVVGNKAASVIKFVVFSNKSNRGEAEHNSSLQIVTLMDYT